MLMNHPAQFQQVAREWAIKHASAPKNVIWKNTAAQAPTAAKPQVPKSLEEELRR
jgi:ubiquitin-conjugating enzyme (huntingtin interacting protein 2)